MELEHKGIFKKEVLSANDFADKYANNIKPQSVYYAMDNDLIDYVTIGDRRFVVMTKRTLAYTPNSSPSRRVKKKKK